MKFIYIIQVKALGYQFISQFVIFKSHNKSGPHVHSYISEDDTRTYANTAIKLAIHSTTSEFRNIRHDICLYKDNLFGLNVRSQVAHEWYNLLSNIYNGLNNNG